MIKISFFAYFFSKTPTNEQCKNMTRLSELAYASDVFHNSEAKPFRELQSPFLAMKFMTE